MGLGIGGHRIAAEAEALEQTDGSPAEAEPIPEEHSCEVEERNSALYEQRMGLVDRGWVDRWHMTSDPSLYRY